MRRRQAIGRAVGQGALGTGATAFTVAASTLGSLAMTLFSLFLTAFFFFFLCTGWGRVLVIEDGRAAGAPRQAQGA